jgi:hypothetical protein
MDLLAVYRGAMVFERAASKRFLSLKPIFRSRLGDRQLVTARVARPLSTTWKAEAGLPRKKETRFQIFAQAKRTLFSHSKYAEAWNRHSQRAVVRSILQTKISH